MFFFLSRKVHELEAQIEQLESRLSLLQDELSRATRQLDAASSTRADLESSHSRATRELADLRESHAGLAGEHERVKTRVVELERLEAVHASLAQDHAASLAELERSKRSTTDSNDKVVALQARIDSLGSEKSALETELGQVRADVSTLRSASHEWSGRVEALEALIANAKEAEDKARADKEDLELRLGEIERRSHEAYENACRDADACVDVLSLFYMGF